MIGMVTKVQNECVINGWASYIAARDKKQLTPIEKTLNESTELVVIGLYRSFDEDSKLQFDVAIGQTLDTQSVLHFLPTGITEFPGTLVTKGQVLTR